MRLSDHATLSLLKTSAVRNQQKRIKNQSNQKIFCDTYQELIELKKCEICTLKCNRYKTLLQVLERLNKK